MKITHYVGIEEEVITIERPQDLYPLIDWFHTKIMDLGFNEELKAIEDFMELASEWGLGSYGDVDSIEYS